MARLNPDTHPAINAQVLRFLSAKEIFTVPDFVNCDAKQLSSVTCLPYKEIVSVKKYLIRKHSAVIQTGYDLYNSLVQNVALIKTGIKSFDKLCNGGLMTGNIYEICGFPATGKTQFCLTLAKNVALEQQQIVYYIDTKRDFSGTKIYDMLKHNTTLNEVTLGEIMNKILVKFITTKHDLVNSLHGIKTEIMEKQLPHEVRVIIVDSLPPIFYQSADHALNNGLMNHIINTMRFLAKEYHIVFIVTNVITQWYDIGSENEPVTESPALGKYWQSIPNARFLINKLSDSCEISLIKSTTLQSGNSCKVCITDEGIV